MSGDKQIKAQSPGQLEAAKSPNSSSGHSQVSQGSSMVVSQGFMQSHKKMLLAAGFAVVLVLAVVLPIALSRSSNSNQSNSSNESIRDAPVCEWNGQSYVISGADGATHSRIVGSETCIAGTDVNGQGSGSDGFDVEIFWNACTESTFTVSCPSNGGDGDYQD
jgi:hypothetical protein